MGKIALVLLFVWNLWMPAGAHAAAACAQSLNVFEMNAAWAQFLQAELQSGKTSIAVLPFVPVLAYREVPPYFPYAFPILLAEYWPPAGPVQVADWRLVAQVMQSLGLAPTRRLLEQEIIRIGERLHVKYLIAGSFDLYQDRIKAYVSYYDIARKQLVNKAPQSFSTFLDARFLSMMGEIGDGAHAAFGHTSIDRGLSRALAQSARRFEAVRDYLQGVLNTSVYDPNLLSVAKVWLKGAMAKDYTFHQAYRELARVSFMMALMAKGRLLDPNPDYLEAEQWIQEAERRATPPRAAPSRVTPSRVTPSHVAPQMRPRDFLRRYGEAKLQFVLGMNALGRKNMTEAVARFEQVRALTPEDGLNQYYLALTYDAMKQTALAGAPRAAAFRMNPCFEHAGIRLF